ncbi:phosphoethanolamine transferase [Methylophilus sp.]|uniref:phosphoethanolamine transferase n=1 Tax=Methylophilus sp. TaxID=29541 RepID=UPI004036F312
MKNFSFPAALRQLFTPQILLIWGVTLWLMVFDNYALVSNLTQLYPPLGGQSGLLLSLLLFFTLITALWLLLISHGRSARWLLALVLFSSAFAGFYMQEFGIIIDTVMLDNLLQTDKKEAAGLFSWQMIYFVTALGVVPALWLLFRAPQAWFQRDSLRIRGLHIVLLLVVLVTCVWPYSAGYASFIREHKLARMYLNPGFTHYSLIKWANQHLTMPDNGALQQVAKDTQRIGHNSKHELVIMVVGETARYDRFSLNGYHKLTNPRLQQENVVSFKQVSSCGTSTGVSVPCMFSILGREQYSAKKAKHMENALDVLKQHKISVLWRDNNSDSKGVATRMAYEDFQSPALNKACDTECRDVGMLGGLDTYIQTHQDKDIMIVLHQMGNHGPEYYRRYPKAFEKFTPVCRSSDLSKCSQQEIDNAYDNAILYTDYFLSEVIQLLKKYDHSHETAMLYVADHGESLGEHGLYLHAAPYMIAPKEQTHVPAILWLGTQFEYSTQQIRPYHDYPLSHDDLFCTLLTAYELKSDTCHSHYNWLIANPEVRAELKLPPLPAPPAAPQLAAPAVVSGNQKIQTQDGPGPQVVSVKSIPNTASRRSSAAT